MYGLFKNADESLIRLLLESNANVNATAKVHPPGDECEGVVHARGGCMVKLAVVGEDGSGATGPTGGADGAPASFNPVETLKMPKPLMINFSEQYISKN